MNRLKNVIKTVNANSTTDGAGVRLHRLLSLPQVKEFDPFLMLDNFKSHDPNPGPGFPWHPHRGIITISYLLRGSMKHEDSLGNCGTVGPGGVQWMKAAHGIVHQEMPQPDATGIEGFQFWLNLPASEKLSQPDYGDIPASEIPEINPDTGSTVRVIAGKLHHVEGPLKVAHTEPEMFHISLKKNSALILPTSQEKNYFLIGIDGDMYVGDHLLSNGEASLLGEGEELRLSSRNENASCMLVGGRMLKEPIAWRGPIVMNTSEELDEAFAAYADGSFLSKGAD